MGKMGQNLKTAKEIIENVLYMNLATVTPEGDPWNTPLVFAWDKNLNLYWLSWKKNQHSINVKSNPKAFVTIYDTNVPSDEGAGVYLEGKAYEASNPKDILIGLKNLYGRQKKKARAVKKFLKKFPRRVYKFKPEKVWINGGSDIKGNYIDIRIESDLEELKRLFK